MDSYVVPENHPIMTLIKKYDWGSVVGWGELTVKFREGKPVLVTIKNEYKVD